MNCSSSNHETFEATYEVLLPGSLLPPARVARWVPYCNACVDIMAKRGDFLEGPYDVRELEHRGQDQQRLQKEE